MAMVVAVMNESGDKIGRIEIRGDEYRAFDQIGEPAGRYDSKTDTTFDRTGRETGRGNQLEKAIALQNAER